MVHILKRVSLSFKRGNFLEYQINDFVYFFFKKILENICLKGDKWKKKKVEVEKIKN